MAIEEQLVKYAKTIVEVGIHLQEGENVVINSDTKTLALLREVVRACWKAGAKDVITRISDDEVNLSYYEEGHDEVFDHFPDFQVDYNEALYKEKYHRIALFSPNVDLYKNVDPEKLHRSSRSAGEKTKHLRAYMDKGDIKWVVAAAAGPRWAKSVYPDLEEAEAIEKLWEKIFEACRIDTENPILAWQEHDAKLKEVESALDAHAFDYLHYEAPGTDLKVYLADKHKWIGGSSVTPDGCKYVANIPTEEVFTAPYKTKVDGTLRATKPLSSHGNLIEEMEFVFENGKVVSFTASSNQEILEKQLDMDEGARYLGEMALVPHSSPISKMGLIFNNTLYDENASCHFALGSSYAETIVDGEEMSQEERLALGANHSMIHVDFMVGSEHLNVTGYKKDGSAVKILENGEFVI